MSFRPRTTLGWTPPGQSEQPEATKPPSAYAYQDLLALAVAECLAHAAHYDAKSRSAALAFAGDLAGNHYGVYTSDIHNAIYGEQESTPEDHAHERIAKMKRLTKVRHRRYPQTHPARGASTPVEQGGVPHVSRGGAVAPIDADATLAAAGTGDVDI